MRTRSLSHFEMGRCERVYNKVKRTFPDIYTVLNYYNYSTKCGVIIGSYGIMLYDPHAGILERPNYREGLERHMQRARVANEHS